MTALTLSARMCQVMATLYDLPPESQAVWRAEGDTLRVWQCLDPLQTPAPHLQARSLNIRQWLTDTRPEWVTNGVYLGLSGEEAQPLQPLLEPEPSAAFWHPLLRQDPRIGAVLETILKASLEGNCSGMTVPPGLSKDSLFQLYSVFNLAGPCTLMYWRKPGQSWLQIQNAAGQDMRPSPVVIRDVAQRQRFSRRQLSEPPLLVEDEDAVSATGELCCSVVAPALLHSGWLRLVVQDITRLTGPPSRFPSAYVRLHLLDPRELP